MRSLPSIVGQQTFVPQIELTMTTAVGSAYVFTNREIDDMSDLRWRGKMGGGLGSVSDYDVRVYLPLAQQKAIQGDLARASVNLRVTVNSDTFNPHLGRVAGFERDASNLDMLNLSIMDRRFYDATKLPVHSITDSWPTPHPVELAADIGFPLYYGDESKRDFTFTAVDTWIRHFIGPKNVTSTSHVGCLFIYDSSVTSISGNYFIVGHAWDSLSDLATPTNSGWFIRDFPRSNIDDSALGDFGETQNIFTFSDGLMALSRATYILSATLYYGYGLGRNDFSEMHTNVESASFSDGTSNHLHMIHSIINTGSHFLLYTSQVYSSTLFVASLSNLATFPTTFTLIGGLDIDLSLSRIIVKKQGPFIFAPGSYTLRVCTNGINYNSFPTSTRLYEVDYDTRSSICIVTGTTSPFLQVSTDFSTWVSPTSIGDTPHVVRGPEGWMAIHSFHLFSVSTNTAVWCLQSNIDVEWSQLLHNGSDYIAIGVQSANINLRQTVIAYSNPASFGKFFAVFTPTLNIPGGPGLYNGVWRKGDPPSQAVMWKKAAYILNNNQIGILVRSTMQNYGVFFKFLQNGPIAWNDYKKNQVFMPMRSAVSIAIATNPLAIIDHINSHHLSYPFLQNQSSAAQLLTNSMAFNCYFAARQPVQDVLNDFGETAGINLWFGDSGMLHYRAYVQSATATGSVDATVTIDDDVKLRYRQNPVGSPLNARVASQFRFEYNYNFQQARYNNVLTVTGSQNSACFSLEAVNVREQKTYSSPYVMTADVASLWSVNRIRIDTQPSNLIELELPPSYLGLELFDVLKVPHQMFPNSVTLGQITDLRFDLLRGRVKATVEELKAFVQ